MTENNLVTSPGDGYALLDSGEGEKLEKYGDVVLARPDPQALWHKKLSGDEWARAKGKFVREGKEGKWTIDSAVPEMWIIQLGGFSFEIRPTSFKHTGLFPEQLSNWQWVQDVIRETKRPVSVLNLFGYTGGATLAAAAAGASVTHVDASKVAVAWARKNAELSGLAEKPIRWIVDDAVAFLERELKRGVHYDAVVMDPPAFGRGPKGQVWKIEENLLPLLTLVEKILSEKPLFVLINGYAAGYAPLVFGNDMEPFAERFGGEVACGELRIEEKGSGRQLPCGMYARWKNKE